MTLLELSEPLFQYICRLNRSARKGGNFSYTPVRTEIEAMFGDILAKGAADPALASQMDKDRGGIEVVLAFFVDFMVRTSALSFAGEWQDLSEQRYNELSGDEKFWDMLDEALADRGEAADQRLSVYYACMGLGFTGWYTGQPEYLRKKMMECSARLRGMIDADEKTPIVGEAELYINTDDLIEPPGKSLVGIGIAAVILIVVLLIGNIYLYYQGTSDLTGALHHIVAMEDAYVNQDAAPSGVGE